MLLTDIEVAEIVIAMDTWALDIMMSAMVETILHAVVTVEETWLVGLSLVCGVHLVVMGAMVTWVVILIL